MVTIDCVRVKVAKILFLVCYTKTVETQKDLYFSKDPLNGVHHDIDLYRSYAPETF